MQRASRRPAEAQPERMAALAKLPVFLDLAGKRAVIAGGSAAAAWKAELLAAAGADVAVYAADASPDMAALIARGAAAGSLVRHARPWGLDIFGHAAIAVADTETDAEAHAFWCAARAAGTPVNVIDKPAYCQFQFGAIVNRSPVVVAISTDGAAPILGQAIRRRIETLLPPTLVAWGRLAKRIRGEVAQRLRPGAQRRSFWERFSEMAFRRGASAEAGEDVAGLIREVEAGITPARGQVTIVGAGPGDSELLTLKAVRALQAADVILYDDLVPDDVLELARREAKRVRVGKRGQRDSCRQEDINDLMTRLARQGRHVVRVKSGDAMVFGRAGEEIAHLEAAGVGVTIVPGITAASAMAAALGVSLTHRDHAQSLRLVTGHARSGELPADLDWVGLADPRTTLVVYMGGRTAPAIAERLLAQGLAQSTPVVAISHLSQAHERRWQGSLGEMGRDGLPAIMEAPVLIGIGTVFRSTEVRTEAVAVPDDGIADSEAA